MPNQWFLKKGRNRSQWVAKIDIDHSLHNAFSVSLVVTLLGLRCIPSFWTYSDGLVSITPEFLMYYGPCQHEWCISPTRQFMFNCRRLRWRFDYRNHRQPQKQRIQIKYSNDIISLQCISHLLQIHNYLYDWSLCGRGKFWGGGGGVERAGWIIMIDRRKCHIAKVYYACPRGWLYFHKHWGVPVLASVQMVSPFFESTLETSGV